MVTRTVKVDIKADISDYNRKLLTAAAATRALGSSLDSSRNQMAGFVQAGLAVGPALVGIGAAGVPAIAGLTNQFALAAAAAGVTVVAFQGVGDATKAMNDYALNPTEAHLSKLVDTMNSLGPAGQHFVQFINGLRPQLQELQNVTQEGLFPGIEQGITNLLARAPQIERIFSVISTTVGDAIAEAGENLSDDRWDEFFDFLEKEAKPTLTDMSRTVGNFAEGFAELWMAFQPLENDFTQGFLNMSRDFAHWADELDRTEGFQDFLAYVERVAPKAGDALGALTDAFIAIVQAAAPVGELSLPILEDLFDILAAFARTPFGPPLVALAAGLGAVSTALRIANFAQFKALFGFFRDLGVGGGVLSAARALPKAADGFVQLDVAAARASMTAEEFERRNDGLKRSLGGVAKAAGFGAGLAFVMSDLDDKMHLTHATSLALAGSLAGVGGALAGGVIGLALDFAAANDDVWDSVNRANKALAQGPENIAQQEAAYEAAGKAIEDFKKRIGDGDDGFFNPFKHGIGDLLAREKNLVEGVFGSSDVEELEGAYRKQGQALKANRKAARDAALSEAGFGSAMAAASESTKDETYALLENIRVKNQAADDTGNIFTAETNWREAVKAATKQAREGAAGIDGMSDAAIKNRNTIDSLKDAFNAQVDAGGLSEAQTKKNREAFIDLATALTGSRERAEELANQLLHTPDAKPKVILQGVDNAFATIQNIKDALRGIKDEDVYVRVRRAYESGGGRGHQLAGSYTGGRVPAGFAGGGVIPGSAPADPSVDNVLAFGANTGQPFLVRSGEWIINESQSRNNDPWLRAINDGLNLGPYPQFAPSFANGGRVGGDGSSLLGAVLSGELTITNWETGEARIRIVAASEAQSALAQQRRSDAGTRQTASNLR